ncbi:amidohydrolase family protein [uncultured Piscinibacter sp.]|uniref:amidohydrolase family protein n=1 Tax=uncultured Piscinibacter sp. TaxID=1131835 RepID=UPI002611176A|nr:amidohydrolase family protein [uncultured Piscinibacter sp.]
MSTLFAVIALVLMYAGSASAAPDASVLVIRNVTVIDVDAAIARPHHTVVVRDGRIERVEPEKRGAATPTGVVIDGTGKFLIPGLVDGHAHLATQRVIDGLIARGDFTLTSGRRRLGAAHSFDRRLLRAFLLNGVTTVVSFGTLTPGGGDELELRTLVDRNEIIGPRLLVGDLIDGADADQDRGTASTIESPRTAEDGRRRVTRAKQQGYDFIKPYTFLNRETFNAVVRTAHELGLRAVGHLPELGCANCATPDDAFVARLDGIAHLEELGTYGLPGLQLSAAIELANRVKAAGQAVVTTLVTSRNIVQMYASRCVPLPPPADLRYVDSFLLSRWLGPNNRYLRDEFRDQPNAALIPPAYDFQRVIARELWKRGVPLVVGTDATIPGVAYGSSVPDEMIELNKIGLPPGDVLKSATQTAFRLLGRPGETGTVAVGQRADLVLLRANPLDYVGNVRQIAGVVVNGRWYAIERLRRLADSDARYYTALDRQIGLHRPTDACARPEMTSPKRAPTGR